MDRDLLNFLRDKTEMGRFQAAEIERVFELAKEAGWHMVRADDLTTDEMRAALEQAKAKKEAIAHNMKVEQEKPPVPTPAPSNMGPDPSYYNDLGRQHMAASWNADHTIPGTEDGNAAAAEGEDVPDEDAVR